MHTTSDFRQRVLASRDCGVIHCEFHKRDELGGDARQVADDLARKIGFLPLGPKWRELTPERACSALERVLGRDLAYGAKTMSAELAKELSREFVALFSGRVYFYTNGEFPPPEAYRDGGWAGSWDPVTRATFDTGVIAVDQHLVALLWIEDED